MGLICEPKNISEVFLIRSMETDTPAKVLKIVAISALGFFVVCLFFFVCLFVCFECLFFVSFVGF